MKAIRIHGFGGPEVLKLEQAPDPQPGPGQVVVRAKAIGVNPVDAYIRAGKYGDRSFPLTLGFDAAGTVESVGSGVRAAKPGDRVYIYGSVGGAYADLILCQENQIHPLSPKISFNQGAALGIPYATAYVALVNRGLAKTGETVLIHGASGGVGTAAIQIARSLGLTVIGTGGSAKGRELILKEGAHHVLDHHQAGYMEQLMALTAGKGVPLIIEMAANVNLGKDLKVLSPRGRVVVVGSRGPVEIDPRDTMSRNADIRGMTLLTATESELEVVHAALGKGLENGSLRPVIGKEFLLAQAAAAQEEVMKPGAHGKIVLVV